MQPSEAKRSLILDGLAQAPVRIAQVTLWCYRGMLSPFLGPSCRFAPSCSAYASEALHRHGLLRGGLMAVRRLLRCHPFHPGGWDPVPRSLSDFGSQQRPNTSAGPVRRRLRAAGGSPWSAGGERTIDTTRAAGPS